MRADVLQCIRNIMSTRDGAGVLHTRAVAQGEPHPGSHRLMKGNTMSKKNSADSYKDPERLNKVGGQAVLEGVMMKAGAHTVTTCRKPDGTLTVYDDSFVSVRKRCKFLNLPIIRGVVNFVEMMKLSFSTMANSADALGLDEEEEGKFEKWLKKHVGIGLTDFVLLLGTLLGIALAVTLFIFLPTLFADLIDRVVSLGAWRAVVEGGVKVIIFLLYLWLVSFIPDIKRTFMYHGAEHKSIACFESCEELTPENAKKHTRFHPRCGTSFMFFMILVGIIAGLFIRLIFPGLNTFAYTGIRLLILPIVVGIGYEIIMYAGKHVNPFTRALSAPGLWVQRLTTKEPDEKMLECAIVSIKCALRDDFPEFREFWQSRGWEKREEKNPYLLSAMTAEERLTLSEAGADELALRRETLADELIAFNRAAGASSSALADFIMKERVRRLEHGEPLTGGESLTDVLLTEYETNRALAAEDKKLMKLLSGADAKGAEAQIEKTNEKIASLKLTLAAAKREREKLTAKVQEGADGTEDPAAELCRKFDADSARVSDVTAQVSALTEKINSLISAYNARRAEGATATDAAKNAETADIGTITENTERTADAEGATENTETAPDIFDDAPGAEAAGEVHANVPAGNAEEPPATAGEENGSAEN